MKEGRSTATPECMDRRNETLQARNRSHLALFADLSEKPYLAPLVQLVQKQEQRLAQVESKQHQLSAAQNVGRMDPFGSGKSVWMS